MAADQYCLLAKVQYTSTVHTNGADAIERFSLLTGRTGSGAGWFHLESWFKLPCYQSNNSAITTVMPPDDVLC